MDIRGWSHSPAPLAAQRTASCVTPATQFPAQRDERINPKVANPPRKTSELHARPSTFDITAAA
jgi:hypothetical protein